MRDDLRRAAENILATVVSIRDSNGEVVIQSRCWLWAREVAQAYLAQQRADETEGGYAGWTIVAEGEDGSLLLQSKTGARRRIWPPHKADDDEPVTDAQANEAAERLAAYYRGEQSGIYYTEEDARAAFTEDILKVAKGYQRLRGQLEQAKIRVEQLEDAGRKLYEDVVARGKGEWPKNDHEDRAIFREWLTREIQSNGAIVRQMAKMGMDAMVRMKQAEIMACQIVYKMLGETKETTDEQ